MVIVLNKISLDLTQVLVWIGGLKIADNLSTISAVSQYSWDAEINVLIGLMSSPLGKHLMLWGTIPVALGFSYLMYRHKFFHPMLEWLIIILVIVPIANVVQNIYIWGFAALFSIFVPLRVAYLDFKNRGWKSFVTLDLSSPVDTMLFDFENKTHKTTEGDPQ